MTDYPEHLLARGAAPPYAGEGAFALWHFSEDAQLRTFRPHTPRTNPTEPPQVWAIDTRHAPMFWFPRDCPRACVWPVSTTTADDRETFFGQSGGAGRIHVIESDWLDRMRAGSVYAYRLPTDAFEPHGVGGYWVTAKTVEAVDRIEIDDLIGAHARARIELRITPSIWPFWKRVVASSVEFSGMRLANAGPHPDRF